MCTGLVADKAIRRRGKEEEPAGQFEEGHVYAFIRCASQYVLQTLHYSDDCVCLYQAVFRSWFVICRSVLAVRWRKGDVSHMDYFGQENRMRGVQATVPIPKPEQSSRSLHV